MKCNDTELSYLKANLLIMVYPLFALFELYSLLTFLRPFCQLAAPLVFPSFRLTSFFSCFTFPSSSQSCIPLFSFTYHPPLSHSDSSILCVSLSQCLSSLPGLLLAPTLPLPPSCLSPRSFLAERCRKTPLYRGSNSS